MNSPAQSSEALPAARLPAVSGLRGWWLAPRLTWWVWIALAALLFLRKPHALHTPQLWAEDGSIFLAFNDLDGVGAWKTPYMGYLHTLPRIIASVAAWLLDPAWWPAFYNGVSFAIWLAVIARTFSMRLELPHKPWLALAFILGPHTGEILFNITNLHWITAFVFLQQALIARPQTTGQRIGDALILTLAGLTGPFVIVFVPLFAWRVWRDRNGDNVVALLTVTVCACVQGWFVVRTGPSFPFQALPFQPWTTVKIISRRLIFWPMLGNELSLAVPKPLLGAVGLAIIPALLAWSLRPHPRRVLRAHIVAAFVLLTAVGVYRARPDTWADDIKLFSDRYFYMPRVLFAWLLILEFDAFPRWIAWTARGMCGAMALAHVPGYTLPTPIDYKWREHVEPIRRGEPAMIATLPEGWKMEYRGRNPNPAGVRR